MENNINWKDAAMELCRRLAKFEFMADKKKSYHYVPNGIETSEITVRAAAIYSDITKRYSI